MYECIDVKTSHGTVEFLSIRHTCFICKYGESHTWCLQMVCFAMFYGKMLFAASKRPQQKQDEGGAFISF